MVKRYVCAFLILIVIAKLLDTKNCVSVGTSRSNIYINCRDLFLHCLLASHVIDKNYDVSPISIS